MLAFMADMPPLIQERIMCSISAAVEYQVPANIILAVAEKEAGKPGQWVRNANGTYDVGVMQFNTAYLDSLAKYGITADDVAAAGCYSFYLAAWRLREHILHDQGDVWTQAANFHSRTYKYNVVYRADLILRASKWAKWLEAHFVTVDLTQPGTPPILHDTLLGAARKGWRDVVTVQPQHKHAPLAELHRRSSYVPRTITSSVRGEGA